MVRGSWQFLRKRRSLNFEPAPGSAIAFPQIARSSGYKGMLPVCSRRSSKRNPAPFCEASRFVSLWIRSYMALGLNYFVQMALVPGAQIRSAACRLPLASLMTG